MTGDERDAIRKRAKEILAASEQALAVQAASEPSENGERLVISATADAENAKQTLALLDEIDSRAMELARITMLSVAPGWWSWLLGYRRPETPREAELRVTLADRDRAYADVCEDKKALESQVRIQQLEIKGLAEANTAMLLQVRAVSASAALYAGLASLPPDRR